MEMENKDLGNYQFDASQAEARIEEALRRFSTGRNCAQAILTTYGEALGLPVEAAMRLTTGMGAGMGRLGQTCGAVSAAYMVLGLRFGSPNPVAGPEDAAKKERMYARIADFEGRFRARTGASQCAQLLDMSPADPDRQRVSARCKAVCPGLIRASAELLEEILREAEAQRA